MGCIQGRYKPGLIIKVTNVTKIAAKLLAAITYNTFMEYIIECKKLHKKFDQKVALNGIDFSIATNGCVGLLGKNGAGKTTLLKIILGISAPTTGKVLYFSGQDLTTEVKKKIGYYLGSDYLPLELTGFQYLQLINLIYKLQLPNSKIEELFYYFFDEQNVLNNPISSYSYGMIQKIGICGSLLNNPQLLILDEPFIGLDSISSLLLMKFLLAYKERHSIIISSHSIDVIEKLCDDLLIIKDTEVEYWGTAENFTSARGLNMEESLLDIYGNKNQRNHESVSWLL